jgi:hypothetical protein
MINYLAMVGWSCDDKTEIMSGRSDRTLTLERGQRIAAVWNYRNSSQNGCSSAR